MDSNLEQGLMELLACREIEKLHFAFMRGQDRLDTALMRSVFHNEADMDCGPFRGAPDAYIEFVMGLLDGFSGTQHMLGQMDITIEGNMARGEIYFFAWHGIKEELASKDLFMAGRYVDEYAYIENRWGIVKRREIIDWARNVDAVDDILTEVTKIHLSGRKGQDFSDNRDWSSGISGR